MDTQSVKSLVIENRARMTEKNTVFNPISGAGAPPYDRAVLALSDFQIKKQYVPKEMLTNQFIVGLKQAGSIADFAKANKLDPELVTEKLLRIRMRYDFCFWAIMYVTIKNKTGGEDIHFKLNRPQRRLVATFEKARRAGKPIRVIVLKARQWGGSTVTQLYISWLQLTQKKGLNSLIVGHVKDASAEVEGMFDKMLNAYPADLLHDLGEKVDNVKIRGIRSSQNIRIIPARNCKIKIGTAEKPDSARGGDSTLVHCTEVAFWKKTDGKTPEQIVRSACSGVTAMPNSMIVYESTANGTGNFFQREYDDAKNGRSQFEAVFVPWYEIELYSMPIKDEFEFAQWLLDNKDNEDRQDSRHQCGKYYWKLWEAGATFDNLNWYQYERMKYDDDADMAAEFPSDDIEAFKHSGERVFDEYRVEEMKKDCRPPKFIGDVYADFDEGDRCMENLRFREDHQGQLWVWNLPEIDDKVKISDRYLVVVDIGGRSDKADWSVIVVFDRYWMIEQEKPLVVAQWYGHVDMDMLAWKAAQIAAFYDEALLVIEANTLETHDRDRNVDGDQSEYILAQLNGVYPNLYARRRSEAEIKEGKPKRYGFHTNISTKPKIISTLIKVVREHLYTERDFRCIDELLTYERKPNGAFGAILGKHDDLLMTRAIGLHICFYEMDYPKAVEIQHKTGTTYKKMISAASI